MGKLAALGKMIKGVTAPEDLVDILEGIGVKVTYNEVPPETKIVGEELEKLLSSGRAKGNKMFGLEAVSEEGHRITAFVVMHGKP